MKNITMILTALFCLTGISGSVFAAKAGLYSKVTTILLDDVNFGFCMAALETPPSTKGLDCEDPWVTFSCSGDFNSKSTGERKLSGAQLALVTQTTFYVVVDDSKKHNGYCFAERADNYR